MKYHNKEDEEDYDQEQQISKWLKENNKDSLEQFDYKYINSKGNVRTSNFQGARLDQELSEDTTTTLLDLVTGCDGRDLEHRRNINYFDELDKYLACLGFDEDLSEWIIAKMLKFWGTKSSLLSEKFLKNLEW